MSSRVALLTGSTGFIGSHLARRLVGEGWTVHAVLRPGSRDEAIRDLTGPRFQRHVTDGSPADLQRIAGECRADVCFHLASLFLASHTPEQIPELVRDNVLFGTQLTDALVVAGTPMLVNAGTSWQHFESRDYSPVALYAATKQAFEDLLRFYTETTPLRAITLKLFDSYGPGDRRKKIFALLKEAAEKGSTLEMTGGEQYIDLVFVEDVVEAFITAEKHLRASKVKYETFAVSSGRPIQVKALVETFSRVTGVHPKIELGKRPYRPREMMAPWSAGAVLPGWAPRVSLEQGIERIYGRG